MGGHQSTNTETAAYKQQIDEERRMCRMAADDFLNQTTCLKLPEKLAEYLYQINSKNGGVI